MGKKFDLFSVSTISAGHFFHDLYSHFLSPALPLIIQNLGISYSQAGMLSVFHRFPALFNPFFSSISTGKSNALIISAAIITTSVSMCFITAAPSYTVLSMLILVMGISACFFHILSPVMIKNCAGDRIGTGMSFYMFGGEMARGIGPITILAAISLFGSGKVYYLIPLAVFMAAFIIVKFREEVGKSIKLPVRSVSVPGNAENPVTAPENKSGYSQETSCLDQQAADFSNSGKNEKEDGFFKVLREMKSFFFAVLMIMTAKASIAASLNAFLPAYLTSTGVSLWFSGISLAIIQISAAAGTMLAGPVADRFGKVKTLLVISALSPFLMFLFLFSSGIYTMVLIVLTGFIAFSSSPVVMAYVQHASGKNPTSCSSIYMMIDFMTICISILITGIAGDHFGLKNAFLICGLISCLGFPFVIVLSKNRLGRS